MIYLLQLITDMKKSSTLKESIKVDKKKELKFYINQ
jgi:hypothetical protein